MGRAKTMRKRKMFTKKLRHLYRLWPRRIGGNLSSKRLANTAKKLKYGYYQ